MKKGLFLIIVIIMITGLMADTVFTIVDSETPSVVENGTYGQILQVSLVVTGMDYLRIRATLFMIYDHMGHLDDLRFEDLQWKIEEEEWEGDSMVNSNRELIIPINETYSYETVIFTLWGTILSDDAGEEGWIKVGMYNDGCIWAMTNFEIFNNFPQEKLIQILDSISDIETNTPDIQWNLQNYPNPFNPKTIISFSLAEAGNVSLEIYNVKGQKVKTLINKEFELGQHQISWEGTDDDGKLVSSGVYCYKMKSGNYTSTKKMILMK
jgi:hypothetical protein